RSNSRPPAPFISRSRSSVRSRRKAPPTKEDSRESDRTPPHAHAFLRTSTDALGGIHGAARALHLRGFTALSEAVGCRVLHVRRTRHRSVGIRALPVGRGGGHPW